MISMFLLADSVTLHKQEGKSMLAWHAKLAAAAATRLVETTRGYFSQRHGYLESRPVRSGISRVFIATNKLWKM
jgi:hypothetical protein